MLEGVFIIRYIIVIVVGIGKEGVSRCKDIACREIGGRQLRLLRVTNDEEVLRVIA